jgi:hypothetical protein
MKTKRSYGDTARAPQHVPEAIALEPVTPRGSHFLILFGGSALVNPPARWQMSEIERVCPSCDVMPACKKLQIHPERAGVRS